MLSTDARHVPPAFGAWTLEARAALGTALLLTALVSLALGVALGLGAAFAARSLLALALVLALAWRWLRARQAEFGFGAANRVTLVRLALVMSLAGALGAPPSAALAWTVSGVALIAAALDGVDGWLARRHGEASAFGARFDMETDALLVLLLALLAWLWDRAGAWVLVAGLARYAFLAAGRLAPWMRRPLPASRRRQAICVAQTLALVACVSPVLTPAAAAAVAFAGVAALTGSFVTDTAWLARRQREG